MTSHGELLALAREIAAEAAELVRRERDAGVGIAGTKTSVVDVVTRADGASEDLIRRRIVEARPDDGIVGEENEDRAGTTGVRWIVDPIDGTVNFLYGIEQYAVSIAVEEGGVVVAGVVLNPATGEEFTAMRGAGAFRNGARIGVRVADSLDVSLVCTGFGYDSTLRAHQGAAVARMLPSVRDIRREGACALDLCSVAMGRSDAYVEEGVHLWDHSAGGLVAEEAGATLELLRTPRGHDLLICAATEVHPRFRDLVLASGFAD